MASLYNLKINNFRGIEKLEHTFDKNLNCIIGHGDSGKTSLLDAISFVLSPYYSLSFDDGDFNKGNISNPIEIEATLINIPDTIISKYDTHLRGVSSGRIIDNMESDDAETAETAITVKLTVNKNLEPIWELVTDRGQEPRAISAYDRGLLNIFIVNEFTDRHFNFNKGNPLYKLFNQSKSNNIDTTQTDILIDTLRETKDKIDTELDGKFLEVIKKIIEAAKLLGIDVSELNAAFDFKDILIKENKVSLHEDGVPLRLRGKGSKRLISLAIQLSIVDEPSVILIDEIEMGLESYRAQHLARILKRNYPRHQIIFTTHSRDVVVELDCENILIMRKDSHKLYNLPDTFQATVRKNPEALFAKRIIVCEGSTEIGLCRALNEYRESNDKESLACLGICLADGDGDNMTEYIFNFRTLVYDVCLFCDTDKKEFNIKKDAIRNSGATIFDCESENSIEDQIFKDLPLATIKKIIEYVIEENIMYKFSLIDSINSKIEVNKISSIENIFTEDRVDIRNALGKNSKKKSWFKNITQGTIIGEKIFDGYNDLKPETGLKKIFEGLILWIEDSNLVSEESENN